MKPAISGSSGRSETDGRRRRRAARGRAQSSKPWWPTAAIMRSRRSAMSLHGRALATISWRGPVGVVPQRPDHHRDRAVGAALEAESDHAARGAGIAAGEGDHAQVAAGRRHRHHGDVGQHRLAHRHRQLVGEQIGQHRRVHQALDERVVGVGGRPEVDAGAGRRPARPGPARSRRGRAVEPSARKTSRGLGQVPLGDRPRTGRPAPAARARTGSPPPGTARRPGRRRWRSARCRGTPRWAGPRGRAADRAGAGTRPRRPGVARGSMRPSAAAMRAAASAVRPASSSASAAISSASRRSAGGAPSAAMMASARASASVARPWRTLEPGANRPAPTTRTTCWSGGRRRRRLPRRGSARRRRARSRRASARSGPACRRRRR